MIILLKEGRQLISSNENSDAIENIVYNCRIGNHVLLGERLLLERIATEFQLTERARAFLRSTAQKMTQQGNLINQISWTMAVDTSNSESGMVPLSIFSNADYCEKSQLLTENLSDARTLTCLAGFYLKANFKGYKLSVRQVAGGGSTTGQCFEALTASPSGAVLCVVDSDRAFQGASIGDTARSAKQKFKIGKDKWRSRLHIIEQRELENLLPQDLLIQCVQKHLPQNVEHVSALEHTDNFFRDYFCIKSGDSTCRVVSSLIKKKQTAKIKVARNSIESPLPRIDSCGTCALDNNCKKSPSLGAGFLALVAQELSDGNATSDCRRWRPELRSLVEQVVGIGLASNPVRV